jgi:hypothetical protein
VADTRTVGGCEAVNVLEHLLLWRATGALSTTA